IGQFHPIEVVSLQRNRQPHRIVRSGQNASISLRFMSPKLCPIDSVSSYSTPLADSLDDMSRLLADPICKTTGQFLTLPKICAPSDDGMLGLAESLGAFPLHLRTLRYQIQMNVDDSNTRKSKRPEISSPHEMQPKSEIP
ncbi:unnamed protein product, partial [Protopolystoma xenopodis]